MPERRLFPEFRDQYDLSRYPFGDAASLQPTDASMRALDGEIFLDASLYPIGGVGLIYINRITVATREVTIEIADQSRKTKASAIFDPLAAPDVLPFTDVYGRPAGIIVSAPARLGRFGSWRIGTHTYNPDATTFAPSCIIPTPEVGVRGILTDAGELLTGDVLIIGDNGVVIRQGATEHSIRVDIVGDPLYVRKLCEPISTFSTPQFIKTINGCPPDERGNFNLTVGGHIETQTILRILPKDGRLVIKAVGETVKRR